MVERSTTAQDGSGDSSGDSVTQRFNPDAGSERDKRLTVIAGGIRLPEGFVP
jgi:hypothetical protein